MKEATDPAREGAQMSKIHVSRRMTVLAAAFFMCYFSLITSSNAFITYDTETQGEGNYQLALNSEWSREDEDGAREDIFEISSYLYYGLTDTVDIILGVPYQFIRVKEAGENSSDSGLSDLSLELKWRVFERGSFSIAVKPAITLPTGDEDKDLGSGDVTYSAFLIAAFEVDHGEYLLNLGYIRNENAVDERENLWHISVAAYYDITDEITLVGNVGLERNEDRYVNTHPAFALVGVIYGLSEPVDLYLGVKGGLNEPETDYSILAGLVWGL